MTTEHSLNGKLHGWTLVPTYGFGDQSLNGRSPRVQWWSAERVEGGVKVSFRDQSGVAGFDYQDLIRAIERSQSHDASVGFTF